MLRGHMDASEYKHVVLGLIFLKYISDAFERRRGELNVLTKEFNRPTLDTQCLGEVVDLISGIDLLEALVEGQVIAASTSSGACMNIYSGNLPAPRVRRAANLHSGLRCAHPHRDARSV